MLEKRSLFKTHSRTSSAVPAQRRDYPANAQDYDMLEEAGRGVSATVHKALCKPHSEVVAIKLLDLENVDCSLEEIIREAQTMRQQSHPNVLPLYCSFVHRQHLWMVMPYVAGGSVLNIMKFAYAEGLEEPIIATILKEVLKGLDYIHRQGGIHRDVKAGNILLDNAGNVMVADFGVAATMERGGSWGNQQVSRNTFVGTPCWMAPEVMEQTLGYNCLADIWSFGITILEMAHGHAPFARYPPMKVLLMTIQNPPPTLEAERGNKHFSKAMRDIVAKCLVKDANKRPTAAQLLEHKFFKTAHEPSYLVKHLLADMPPVTERVKLMRKNQAPQSQSENNKRFEQSNEAYVKGVSSWNFDVAALKAEAEADAEPMPTIPEAPPPVPPASELGTVGSDPGEPATSGRTTQDRPGLPTRGSLGTSTSQKSLTSAKSGPPPSQAKRHGRFDVYEGEAPAVNGIPPEPSPNLARESQDWDLPGTSAPGEPERAAAKRRGRFHVVDEKDVDGKAAAAAASQGAAIDRGMSPAPPVVPTTALLPALKEALESCASSFEVMKEVVAAVSDAERGRSTSMAGLLANVQSRQASRLAEQTQQMAQMKEENQHLRERIRQLEDSLQRQSVSGDYAAG